MRFVGERRLAPNEDGLLVVSRAALGNHLVLAACKHKYFYQNLFGSSGSAGAHRALRHI